MKYKFVVIVTGIAMVLNAHAGAVVVSKTSPLPVLDTDHTKKIFLGREFTVNGQTVSVLYQGVGPVRTEFETKILGKTGAELTEYWSKLIFTGRATSPIEAGAEETAKAMAHASPDTLSYLSDAAWSKLVFTGKVAPPIEAGGDDSVKALLHRMPDAIGYVSDAAVDSSLKVLLKY